MPDYLVPLARSFGYTTCAVMKNLRARTRYAVALGSLALAAACTTAANELSFNGVDDHVVIPDPGGLDGPAVTIEAFVWPEAGGQDRQNLVARRSPGGGQDSFTFRLRHDMGGVLELGLAKDHREWGTAGKIAVAPGRWTFVAVTHDRTSGRICFTVGETPDACATSPIGAGTAPDEALWLGGDPLHGPTSRPLKGKLKDVRIWTVLRTAAELRVDASGPTAPGRAGLAWTSDGAR